VEKSGIPIGAKTLDELLEGLGDPPITILKMDIEGYEQKALRDFKNSKQSSRS
jgi:hypothetical protein